MRKRERRGREYWAVVVAEFERSSLTQREFCQKRGFTFLTFRHWLYRLRREGESTTARFVPLVPSPAARKSPVQLRVRNVEVEFSELPEASFLAELLRLMDQ